MNEPLHIVLASGLEHVECAADVGVDVAIRRAVRVRNRDQRGEMRNLVAAFYRVVNAERIANVAGNHINTVAKLPRNVVKPAPGVEGVVVDESSDLVTGANKRFSQVRANKPISSSYQDLRSHTWLMELVRAEARRTNCPG